MNLVFHDAEKQPVPVAQYITESIAYSIAIKLPQSLYNFMNARWKTSLLKCSKSILLRFI